jgi:hypothetical protein
MTASFALGIAALITIGASNAWAAIPCTTLSDAHFTGGNQNELPGHSRKLTPRRRHL